jgi:prepilin-type N-terminal cleavage/methylation domain-containing protein
MEGRTVQTAKKRFDSSTQDGFTLIELLIVIVILGILAGIAIFAVGAFQTDATTACRAANTRIDATVNAAISAGGSGSYTAQGGSC